tara:strand:- start:5190 stop:5405 length:216 start_codon:yes stop_codon:yes gene_type:complete
VENNPYYPILLEAIRLADKEGRLIPDGRDFERAEAAIKRREAGGSRVFWAFIFTLIAILFALSIALTGAIL